MPARAIQIAAGARPAWGMGVWLALVAVGLQAPSISVRHCHAGGGDDHHHAAWPVARQPALECDVDPGQSHGHRVIWGLDLHDPSSGDSDSNHGDGQPPVGVIQASLTAAEECQFRPTVSLPATLVGDSAHSWVSLQNPSPPCGFQKPAGSSSGPLVLRV